VGDYAADLLKPKLSGSKLNKAEKQIIESIDNLADDIIDFACRLVAEPSTLENEATVLRVMEIELARLSFDPVRVPVDPIKLSRHAGFAPVPWSYEGRYNVVARREAVADGGHSVIFNGHLDVVSPEPLGLWDTDPFEPVIRDGWIYGRGAGDMKSGVAAMTYAVHAIEKAGFGFRAPVIIEAVIEEECSGNGALACVAAGYEADAVLIPEPTGPAILTAQLGVMWFKVSLAGVPRHVHEAQAGVNAVEKCIPIIAALRNLEAEMNREIHPIYKGIPHPINLNVGIIKGGDWPSTVPAAAEFHCRLSFFPGTTYDQMRQCVTETIARAAESDPWLSENQPKIEFYGFRSEGHVADRHQPAFNILNDCHHEFCGQDTTERISTATTDVRAFHHFTRAQATCYGPVAENSHAANERVTIASVILTAKVYALFLARWCGLAE
jgi:acetylornithine deacetylase